VSEEFAQGNVSTHSENTSMSSNVIQKNQQQQHSEQDSNQQPSYSTQHHSIRDFFLDYLKPIVASIVQETGFGAIESLDLLEILANILNLCKFLYF